MDMECSGCRQLVIKQKASPTTIVEVELRDCIFKCPIYVPHTVLKSLYMMAGTDRGVARYWSGYMKKGAMTHIKYV
jgi:hypothetical protein